MNNLLQVKQLKKYYGNQTVCTKALDGISFDVEDGTFLGIMGASGSGKTTLLNCIATMDVPTQGDIILDGIRLSDIKEKELAKFRRNHLGFIFQEFNLLDTLTIQENIELALTLHHVDASQIEQQVIELSTDMGIGDILSSYPYQVSGGQKQRCACARAMITKPKLILADEPTGALDRKSSTQLLSIMQQMNEQSNATIIMVTHDAFTASYANRILFLADGKLYKELRRGEKDRLTFYQDILDMMQQLGGAEE